MSAAARRRQVPHAVTRGLSRRRACALLRVSRSTISYEAVKPTQDAPVVAKMHELSGQYPRYGYRRIRVFLAREGHRIGTATAHRLWRLAKLPVPQKRPRRRVASSRPRPKAPTGPNQVWAYDFVFDACANGQKLWCLKVIDEFTRAALAIDVAGSIRSRRVIDVIARLVSLHGARRYMRSDNGPEFVSYAIPRWISEAGVETARIDLGKPWKNRADDSFNGKFRDECLSARLEWRAEGIVVIEAWRERHNEIRPHSSLGYLTPKEHKQQLLRKNNQTVAADLT